MVYLTPSMSSWLPTVYDVLASILSFTSQVSLLKPSLTPSLSATSHQVKRIMIQFQFPVTQLGHLELELDLDLELQPILAQPLQIQHNHLTLKNNVTGIVSIFLTNLTNLMMIHKSVPYFNHQITNSLKTVFVALKAILS